MKTYKKIYTQTREKTTSTEVDFILIWKDSFFKEEIISIFDQEKIIDIDVTKNFDLEKIENNLLNLKPNRIITDSKKIFKKYKKRYNMLYYKQTRTDNTSSILFYENENDLNFVSQKIKNEYKIIKKSSQDKDIFSIVKSNFAKSLKIVSIENEKIEIALKINGTWLHVDNNEIEDYFSFKNNYSISSKEFGKTNKSVSEEILFFDRSKISYGSKYKESNLKEKKYQWVLNESFYSEFLALKNSNGIMMRETSNFKLNEVNNYAKLKNNLLNNQKINGIQYKNAIETESNLMLETENGKFFIEKNDNDVSISCLMFSKKSEHEIDKFKKGMFFNLKSFINIEINERKIKPSQIVKSLIGIILLIVLVSITFTFIFDQKNLGFLFTSLLNVNSWNSPWMYLIISSFVFSLFFPFFVAIFMERVVLKKDKVNFKSVSHYFVAGAIRNTATFLTGNYFLAMFLWGWYLNRKLNIRSTALVGTVSIMSIFKAFVLMFIGGAFMISGTFSYLLIYNKNPETSAIVVLVVAWCGFAWNLIHSSMIYILVISPFTIRFILNFNLRFKNRNSSYNKNVLNNAYYNNLAYLNTKKTISFKQNREQAIRMMIIIGVPMFIEGLETIYYFNYVDWVILSENGMRNEYSVYYNVISLTGLRYVSNQIHHFPIINILPGRGMMFSEYGLNNLYESVYQNHHSNSNWADLYGGYTSSDLAQITAFTTRFFNVYLNTSIILMVATFAIAKEIFIRKREAII